MSEALGKFGMQPWKLNSLTSDDSGLKSQHIASNIRLNDGAFNLSTINMLFAKRKVPLEADCWLHDRAHDMRAAVVGPADVRYRIQERRLAAPDQ